MGGKYTDFSQLSANLFKKPAPSAEPPKKPAALGDSADEEVLNYFASRLSGAKAKTTPRAGEARDESADLKARLAAAEAECRQAKEARDAAEARCAATERRLAQAEKELLHVQGDCGRLRGELEKLSKEMEQPAVAESASVQAEAKPTSPKGFLLTAPANLTETFPGEVREMVIATLSEGRDAAAKGTRERRAAVLSAVLAENKASGELERRRARLKQILKDCGDKVDPRAFETVGMKLISGRNHWKLQYADVRMPISKTPSDFRSSLNAAADMANRCF